MTDEAVTIPTPAEARAFLRQRGATTYREMVKFVEHYEEMLHEQKELESVHTALRKWGGFSPEVCSYAATVTALAVDEQIEGLDQSMRRVQTVIPGQCARMGARQKALVVLRNFIAHLANDAEEDIQDAR